ncbi:cyanophycinase [Novosphingobium cyanobacteriorum]|uniref:Cyanophycinase n=1 Tax=Novosphingobium cyanobacteriorum TaxID=3024215 RepID=A0ABT6CEW0_9SPHN|nr:cyanophycinase [Novosphingobium cyanobacteriorum]MDF8332382.1 cyanophycinase [Novosphingobium cyanobacteriorum]
MRAIASLLAALLLLLSPAARADGLRHYVEGDLTTPTPGPVSGGLLLMGGGDRNTEAMRWFFAKAGHGHIVILRASLKGEIGEEFYRGVGGIASAETFVIFTRRAASNSRLLAALRRADGIFLSGGDQARYVRRWGGTEITRIIDAHVAAGKPLGGTSAGLAVLGEKLYGAMDGNSITSPKALADPFGKGVTIEGDFLHLARLKGVVTDSHFKERQRLGRLFAFLAKAQMGRPSDAPAMLGLGIDENASLAVEPDGSARIFATAADGGAWLVDGSALRLPVTPGPLVAGPVNVTGVGQGSVLHLPAGRVGNPSFVKRYTIGGGTFTELP